MLKNGGMEEIASAAEFIASPGTEYGCELRDAAIALGALEPPVSCT